MILSDPTFADELTLAKALEKYNVRDIDGAIADLKELAKSGDREPLLHLTRVHMRSGKAKDALKSVEKLVARYPNDPEVHYLYGLVHLNLMSEVSVFKFVSTARKAKAGWDKSVELDPGYLNGLYALFSYYANAPKVGGGDIEQARRIQQKLTKLDEGYATLARGVLLNKDEDFAGAEAAFIKATEIMDTAGAYFGLAQFYIQREQYEKALTSIDFFFTKPADLWDPDITAGHLVIARANAGLGNIDQARAAAKRGLSLSPNKRMRGLLEDTLQDL